MHNAGRDQDRAEITVTPPPHNENHLGLPPISPLKLGPTALALGLSLSKSWPGPGTATKTAHQSLPTSVDRLSPRRTDLGLYKQVSDLIHQNTKLISAVNALQVKVKQLESNLAFQSTVITGLLNGSKNNVPFEKPNLGHSKSGKTSQQREVRLMGLSYDKEDDEYMERTKTSNRLSTSTSPSSHHQHHNTQISRPTAAARSRRDKMISQPPTQPQPLPQEAPAVYLVKSSSQSPVFMPAPVAPQANAGSCWDCLGSKSAKVSPAPTGAVETQPARAKRR